MTNNELIEIIDKKIEEVINGEIEKHKSAINESVKRYAYGKADTYQSYMLEDELIKSLLKEEIHNLIESLNLK